MSNDTKCWVSYITWIPGLFFFLMEKEDKTLRVHAAQSMIFGIGYHIITIVLGWIPFFEHTLNPLLGLVYFVVTIICIVKAHQGDIFRIPMVFDHAERLA